MPTLNAVFKIFDGASGPLGVISKRSDEATNKILKASGVTDNLNNKLKNTGAAANSAANGIGNYVRAAISVVGAIKGLNVVDTYINTQARLNLINDGLQTQAELQNKIFAAADRSRGAYSSMAASISKMGILAGDAFGSNDEIINFTELLQKTFRVGGSSTQEQSAGMYQLTQAMAAGKLQGDEFRSIMENAPMLAQAIADFTGKSKGELKEMSSEGTITADVIKGALFSASDDINAQFEKMPKTFGDVWNKIKNGGVQAFSGIMESVNQLVNTSGFDDIVDGFIGGMYALANTIQWLINMTTRYFDYLAPILEMIGGVLLVVILEKLWAIAAAAWAAIVPWLIAHWVIILVVGAIVLVANVLSAMGVTASDVFGYVGGAIGVLIAWFTNLGITAQNAFIFVLKSVDDMVTRCVNDAIGAINLIIKALNKIPGVEISLVDQLDNSFGNLKYQKLTSYSDAYKAGSQIGKNAYTGISSKLSSLTDFGKDGLGTTTNPLMVQGAGANGSLKVDMSDEDIQYLRDIAERDYINKFSSKTLAPNIQVTFGDVREEADVDKVAGRIKKILQEEIATASEGVYEG
jgi:tape measure domain-containing protein